MMYPVCQNVLASRHIFKKVKAYLTRAIISEMSDYFKLKNVRENV